MLKSIIRSRRLTALRRIAGFVVAVAAIWIVLYSLPFLIHFGVHLRSPARVESKALKEAGGNHRLLSPTQMADISNAYDRYGNSFWVKRVFREYKDQAQYLEDLYGGTGALTAAGRLDAIIVQLAGVIASETSWPIYEPAKKKIKVDDGTKRLLDELKDMSSKEGEATARRASRALTLWGLFEQYLQNRASADLPQTIWDQVDAHSRDPEYNSSERKLGDVLRSAVGTSKAPSGSSSLRDVNTSLAAFEDLKGRVNAKDAEPEFVLGEAVEELAAIRGSLVPGVHNAQIAAINAYIAAAEALKKEQKYVCIVKNIAGFDHVHIEVTKPGGSPSWSEQTQFFKGDEIDLRWKPGDEIYVAYDEEKHTCKWGNQPSDMQVFDDEYALYQLDGKVSFSDIGKTVTLGFKGGLREKLPKLK
jgi:hypothetical protein